MNKPQQRKRMARKLNPQEAAVFNESFPQPQTELPPQEQKTVGDKLAAQHDTALLLSPESGVWFGVEIPASFKCD